MSTHEIIYQAKAELILFLKGKEKPKPIEVKE